MANGTNLTKSRRALMERGEANGAALAVTSLIERGVTTVFGLPGIQLDAFFSALYDHRSRITVIDSRHEQGAAYMALGYAEATGKPGVFTVVPGPGMLNAGAAIATAYACGSPMLALIGQVQSTRIGEGHGELHELPDQAGIVSRLVRSHELVLSPQRVSPAIHNALDALERPGAGPAAIELPPDVLAARLPADSPPANTAPNAAHSEKQDSNELASLAELIRGARRPIIFAGRGAAAAADELRRLAHRCGIPVVAQGRAKGILDDRDPLSLNYLSAAELWSGCDLAIAVGTRMKHPLRAWPRPQGMQLVVIDIDPLSAPAIGEADLFIRSDARMALAGLMELLPDLPVSFRPEILAAKKSAAAKMECGLAPQMAMLRAIRAVLPEDGIIVTDYTQVGYVANAAFPASQAGNLITSGYQGTLGYAFPTAIGAKVAHPNRQVVAIAGDGGFLFAATELATAVKHRIGVVTLVFNDGRFGNVRRIQETVYGGRVIATDLTNPDFLAFAKSFGAYGERARTPAELEQALNAAFGRDLPTVIEVPVGEFPDPWPLILPQLPDSAVR